MRKILSRGLGKKFLIYWKRKGSGGLSGPRGIRRLGAALGVGCMRERQDGQEEPKI